MFRRKNAALTWLERLIPDYARLPLLAMLVCNCAAYWLARAIASGWTHYDLTLPVDALIPVLPWTSVIYLGCYLFWVVNYILAVRPGRDAARRFTTAELAGKALCFIIFLLLPTTATRPEVTGPDVWSAVLRQIYSMDAADNLFPSIHCYVSWMCYLGVRRQETIPRWYRALSCAIAVAVFISTLTTKQHVIADVAGGVALAELCTRLTERFYARHRRQAP